MAGAFAKSAFKSVEGSGVSRAKKLADIYIKQHMTGNKVNDSGVYQYVIDNYLSPYADDLTVQTKIEAYKNDAEQWDLNKQKISGSLSALKLKEQASWYVNDEGAFRNPLAVAQDTSDNLDRLVAETIMAKNELETQNKDTSDIASYLYDLNKKADRMRSVVADIEGGGSGTKEGYGYYLDTDPNTGVIRGASFAPVDIKVNEVQDGKNRTDSTVKVNNAQVPVYVSSFKDSSGAFVSKLGDTQYTGDTNLMTGNGSDLNLNDSALYKYDGLSMERGKVYSAYTGETYQDGSPKKKMYYKGYDDSTYAFDENDQKGKDLLDSLSAVGAINKDSIPKINSYTAMGIVTKSLDDTKTNLGAQAGKIIPAMKESAQYQTEADRINGLGFFGRIKENTKIITGQYDNNVNRQSKPEVPPSKDTGSFIDKAKGFFRKRVGITSPTGGFTNPM